MLVVDGISDKMTIQNDRQAIQTFEYFLGVV